MKKIISLLLSLLMVCAGSLALAEDTVDTLIVGRIGETLDDGSFVVTELVGGGKVHVLEDVSTRLETEWALSVGDVVMVEYDGRMTRSMPPQAMALVIRSHSLEGIVEDVDTEGNRVLINSVTSGQVWLTLPVDANAEDFADKAVRAYYNGVMALSLPGQAFAYTIEEVHTETGVITAVEDGHFLMTWGESELRVNVDGHTKVVGEYAVGDSVWVVYNGIMTRSMPGQIFAQVVAKGE